MLPVFSLLPCWRSSVSYSTMKLSRLFWLYCSLVCCANPFSILTLWGVFMSSMCFSKPVCLFFLCDSPATRQVLPGGGALLKARHQPFKQVSVGLGIQKQNRQKRSRQDRLSMSSLSACVHALLKSYAGHSTVNRPRDSIYLSVTDNPSL